MNEKSDRPKAELIPLDRIRKERAKTAAVKKFNANPHVSAATKIDAARIREGNKVRSDISDIRNRLTADFRVLIGFAEDTPQSGETATARTQLEFLKRLAADLEAMHPDTLEKMKNLNGFPFIRQLEDDPNDLQASIELVGLVKRHVYTISLARKGAFNDLIEEYFGLSKK